MFHKLSIAQRGKSTLSTNQHKAEDQHINGGVTTQNRKSQSQSMEAELKEQQK